MKFTDGNWWLREGVEGYYPVQVYECETAPHSVSLIAPVRDAAAHRGATLNCPVLTFRFSSPAPNVIRVRMEHFRGGVQRPPAFELPPDSDCASVRDTGDAVELTSGDLKAVIHKKDWSVEYFGDGRRLTDSGFRNAGYMEVRDGRGGRRAYCKDELALGVGENVYGLGERFTPFVKNGQVVDIWNADGGTSSEQAYKNIPFYMTNRGYGVFVNHPGRVSFEVGSEKVSRTGFSVPGESLEYLVIYGPGPRQILQRYTALTGRPALPPAWSFGLWLTTSFLTDYDEETVTGMIEGMKERDLPLHVFHFDCFWMKGLRWCDLEWNPDVFPDPQGMLRRLKSDGLKVCVWINPYIAQRSPLFQEGMEKGYLLKTTDGDVWQCNDWQAGMGIVDFTNPEATGWYCGRLRKLADMGVDAFKTDFGERIPTDVVYHNGADPIKMHNVYTQLYNQAVFETLEEKFGKNGAVLFARSATVGGQKFPVHWGGDCSGAYESMAETLRGGLSLCSSGFGFWSHDIGGFESNAPADVYKRWIAFGMLSSHSRLHGSHSYRVPWLYDEESVDVLRFFTRLKCRLMPYLFQKAVEAHREGCPVMRPMFMEFPGDLSCEALDRQYMFGEALLVAPVMREDGLASYYLPGGLWTNFLTGDVLEGGRWVQGAMGYLEVPLMVRPGSVVPVGACDFRPDYNYAEDVVFHIYEPYDGMKAIVEVPDMEGDRAMELVLQRDGGRLTLTAPGAGSRWSAVVHSASNVPVAVESGTMDGCTIIPDSAGASVSVTLRPSEAGVHAPPGARP